MSSRAASDPATILRTTAASSVGSPRPFIMVYVSTGSSVSPFARSSALRPLERPRWEVGLEAGYAMTANRGVVRGASRQLQAVSDREIDRVAGRRQPEPDRAALDDDDFVVSVLVGRVPIARTVRPRPWVETLIAQP